MIFKMILWKRSWSHSQLACLPFGSSCTWREYVLNKRSKRFLEYLLPEDDEGDDDHDDPDNSSANLQISWSDFDQNDEANRIYQLPVIQDDGAQVQRVVVKFDSTLKVVNMEEWTPASKCQICTFPYLSQAILVTPSSEVCPHTIGETENTVRPSLSFSTW